MDHDHHANTDARALPMARSMCWHCQSEVTDTHLCGQCVKVQPLSKDLDYFTCMRVPRLLDLDETKLQETFYELSRTFHPDFYSQKDDQEQTISLGNSALLNTAYRTLKDPLSRAEYLIRLEAGSLKERGHGPPADLFEEILELKEQLDEYRALPSDRDSEQRAALRTRLTAHRERLETRRAEIDGELRDQFRAWDQVQRQHPKVEDHREEKDVVLGRLHAILSHNTYLRNIVNELAAVLT